MENESTNTWWQNWGRKIDADNPALTKPLTRLGQLGRSMLKRFIYSQMAFRSGLMIALGKEQPLVKFKIENDPPSIYWVYKIKAAEVDGLAHKLGIPPQFSLAPIRCLENDEPEYVLAVNAYRVSGLANGLRAEWSVFVRDASGTPRYLIVDARSSQASMDPISIITKASPVMHEREGNVIRTQIGGPGNHFASTITLPDDAESGTSSVEWVSANDHIFWGNGVSDQTYYNASLANARQLRVGKSGVRVEDHTFWGTIVEPEPLHVLVFDGEIDIVISPWENIDRVGKLK